MNQRVLVLGVANEKDKKLNLKTEILIEKAKASLRARGYIVDGVLNNDCEAVYIINPESSNLLVQQKVAQLVRKIWGFQNASAYFSGCLPTLLRRKNFLGKTNRRIMSYARATDIYLHLSKITPKLNEKINRANHRENGSNQGFEYRTG